MANTQQQTKYYPQSVGNPIIDQAFRQIYDYIYEQAGGLSGTLTLPSGFAFNGKTVTSLTFTNGELTSAS